MTDVPHQSSLSEYDDGDRPEPPRVIIDVNVNEIRAPSDNTKLAGKIGIDKRKKGKAYISHKKRGRHLYRKKQGYAISTRILHILNNRVHTLYWVEHDHSSTHPTTYEFSLDQYLEDALGVKHAPENDPQVVLPNDEANHIWPNHNPEHDVRP